MNPFRAAALCVSLALAAGGEPLVVASKDFNESYILGEIMAQLLESDGFEVERRFGLGGTLICYDALRTGEIDLYAEYTGTLATAILKRPDRSGVDALNDVLAREGLTLLPPFGFNNTYALAVPRALARSRGLLTISGLVDHPDLRIAVSHEFLEREDGWPGLSRVYGFDRPIDGIEHGLAYQALEEGTIDLTDAYSTDGELVRYDLVVLRDDRDFFPRYLAAPLVRNDLPQRAKGRLRIVADTLDDPAMQALNASVLFEDADFAEAAAGYLEGIGIESDHAGSGSWSHSGSQQWRQLGRNTLRHLELTVMALVPATLVGIGLGLLVFRIAWLARSVVYAAGLLQTIPSIALLAFMIPLFGIGVTPAIVALFLYSLLPIVRNTVTALSTIDPVLQRVSLAMGLTRTQRLRHVFVPLAVPSILAGIRTAAVISIGTATLAAFIGAGGLGDPIVTGLALNDHGLILQGALPAALLAIFTEFALEGVERMLSPRHLRAATA